MGAGRRFVTGAGQGTSQTSSPHGDRRFPIAIRISGLPAAPSPGEWQDDRLIDGHARRQTRWTPHLEGPLRHEWSRLPAGRVLPCHDWLTILVHKSKCERVRHVGCCPGHLHEHDQGRRRRGCRGYRPAETESMHLVGRVHQCAVSQQDDGLHQPVAAAMSPVEALGRIRDAFADYDCSA
jgi:hypothetical protein